MSTGVVLVAFNTGPLLLDCVNSLLASQGADLRILVVDNGSSEDTAALFEGSDLADKIVHHDSQPGSITAGTVALWTLADNHGFAGGVNHGVRTFMAMADVEYIWVLNPDAQALPQTAAVLEARAQELGDFGILSGRIQYAEDRDVIQSDGGKVDRWTGVTHAVNNRQRAIDTPLPNADMVDFVSGAHMFCSKEFVRQAGEMPTEYFLYYEETDWCLQRGDLPLVLVEGAEVYHVGGSSIGSKTTTQKISPLSAYFMARSRMRFVRKFYPTTLPMAFAYTVAKGVKLLLTGERAAAHATWRGAAGFAPNAALRSKIGARAILQ